VEIPDQRARTRVAQLHSFRSPFVKSRLMKKRKEKQRVRWDDYSGPIVGCAAGFSVNPKDGQVGTCAILPRPFSNVDIHENCAQTWLR
jgi:hypothetical protein